MGSSSEVDAGAGAPRPGGGRSPRCRASRRLAAVALAAAALTAGLAGCGDDGGGDDGGGLGAGGSSPGESGAGAEEMPPVEDAVVMEGDEVAVTSLDNTFRPPNIEVRPGATVVWSNRGRNQHDILPVEGAGWGVEIGDFQPGDTYQHTFDEPGTYRYYCSIHGTTTNGMVGAVVVAE